MFAKTIGVTALLWGLAFPAAAQRVTEATVPLADPDVHEFVFTRDVALAIDYQGSGKVVARINAYDLSRAALVWRQEVPVQESDESPGAFLTPDDARNRLYFGNGPVSALDAATGRTLWSLDCRTSGSVDMEGASLMRDGDLLLEGSDGCGDFDKLRALRVDGATGAVRWQAEFEPHGYKTGNVEHHDYSMYYERTAAASTQVLLVGRRLAAVDYATGRQIWALRDEPGRWVPTTPQGLSLWCDDGKLIAYSTRDGTRQWAFDLHTPWALVYAADTTATSDLIAITWKGAFRIDRSGHTVWSLQREANTWGQDFSPSVLMLAMKLHTWAAVDPATGRVRWSVRINAKGTFQHVDPRLSPAQTGIVLITGYENDVTGPRSLNGVDAATGHVLWTLDQINGTGILNIEVFDGPRLVVRTDDERLVELDVKTGAVRGAYVGDLPRSPFYEPTQSGYRVRYESHDKTLYCYGPTGQVVWTRKGMESASAHVWLLDRGVVVWPTQDGKVELIDLVTGASLYTAMGNQKPSVGVDREGGRVLVPQGNTLKILTVTS